jgi:valine dehydrogenase (NAD+)
MRASAAHRWGTPSLAGRRVGISGVGKVGRRLVELLRADGASVVICDVSAKAVASVLAEHPDVEVAADAIALTGLPLDVYSPNAMGHALDGETIERLQAQVVCGAANNQLAVEGPGGSADQLDRRGILYAPDFVVNGGGVIQVADELHGFDFERARARTAGIYDTTLAVLQEATARGVTTAEAANRLAEERIAAATPGGLWLPAGR